MSELSLLLVFAVLGALWFDHRRVQDIAVARCRQACERAGVQFLDDVAPAWRVRLARDANGALRLQRLFTFEYSTAAGERRSGSIVMLGRVPVALRLEDGVEVHDDADRFYP
jgi:Protein of unknown function (DUF3301)